MSKPVELRFIPLWLKKALSYYNADHQNVASIVSQRDVQMYKLANYVLRSKVIGLGIRDFIFPDAELEGSFNEEDARFALFGPNAADNVLASYALDYFDIMPDKYDGVVLYECTPKGEPKLLIEELVKTIGLYRGKDEAYRSEAFLRFLQFVNKNTTAQVRDAEVTPENSPAGTVTTGAELNTALKQRITNPV